MPDNINESIFEERSQSFDFRAEFFKIYANWKLFAIALFIFFVISFLYLRYTIPIYQVQCSVLIKDDSKSNSQDLAEQMDIFKKGKNIQNEMAVIKSKPLSQQTVLDLGLYISYYYKSNKLRRTVEIYDNCPFYILLDTSHIQLLETPIKISFSSKNNVNVSIEGTGAVSCYDFKNSTTNGKYSINQEFSKKIKIGDVFETDYLKFKILPRNSSDSTAFDDGITHDYSFTISDPMAVGGQYAGSLGVGMTNKDATIIDLSIQTNLPQKAIDYLNKLSENYIKLDLEEKNLTAIKTIEFIDSQLNTISDSLNNVEDLLENFRTKNHVMDISSSGQTLLAALSDQDKEKAMTNLECKYYEYLINYLEKSKDYTDLIVPATIGIGDASMNSMVGELITLSTEKSKISLTTTENNPIYTSIINEIASTKVVLLKNVQSALEMVKITLKDVNQRLELTESEIYKLPKKERQLLDVQRKFNVSDATYSYLLQKKADAEISRASNFSSNKIINDAELVGQVSPNKKRFYTIAFILGLLLPYGFIKLKELSNDSIQDKADIEKYTKIPVLGIIAHSTYEINKVVLENPRSMAAETIRAIKANVDFITSVKNSNIIAITSTISKEGKTYTAINIASAYAISDKKTLLVAADLRKPKIYHDFNLTNEIGLSTYLIGKVDLEKVILKTDVENLSIIPSGPVPPNPTELLGGKKMQELCDILRSRFEYIVFDTPPVGIVSDALPLMRYSDANIYIVRHNYTSRKVLADLNLLVKSSGVTNFCIVLNDVYFTKNKYGRYYSVKYGRGYGYGYGYGYGGYSYRYDDSYYTE